MSKQFYHYLALGDSYTIGEQVPEAENFPNRTVALLKQNGIDIAPARIIAKTGWTTDELGDGINKANEADPLLPTYDFVSLLIGVNNQYRGRCADNYAEEFLGLLKQAIVYADGRKEHVAVISIPDWGVTPFAADRDGEQIAKEIDNYNAVNKKITDEQGIRYIDITPWTREATNDLSLITSDGLHPSGKEYERWAKVLSDYFLDILAGKTGSR